ncbi:COMM domain-containing protein 5 [Leptinotarsa decemlineata]|uniref:COMM domain-containing protein 5 n=1 Tax=Leptinotarsa decemlineata TaxID=7539 RepID=UPI003D306234
MSLKELPKNVVNLVLNSPKEYQSQLFKMALLAHKPTDQDHSELIKNFSKETDMPKEQIYNILGVYIALIKLFLEINESDFNQKLLEFGFTTDFLQKLPFFKNPNGIIDNLMDNHTDFGKMSLFKWRIDISLSNSTLVKKVPMNLLVSLTMKNGKNLKIKIEAKEFHRLRFNIALILKELNSLRLSK